MRKREGERYRGGISPAIVCPSACQGIGISGALCRRSLHAMVRGRVNSYFSPVRRRCGLGSIHFSCFSRHSLSKLSMPFSAPLQWVFYSLVVPFAAVRRISFAGLLAVLTSSRARSAHKTTGDRCCRRHLSIMASRKRILKEVYRDHLNVRSPGNWSSGAGMCLPIVSPSAVMTRVEASDPSPVGQLECGRFGSANRPLPYEI
jgi:hypothetical protein